MAKRLTTEIVIEQFKEILGESYDYSMVNYINDRTKVEIICPKHGSFFIQPNQIKQQKQGCPKCGYEKSGLKQSLGIEKFIEKINKMHGDGSWDFSKAEYRGAHKPITLKCNGCGCESTSKPANFYRVKGCKFCTKNNKRPNSLTNEKFISRSREIHGDKYDYSLVDYHNGKSKLTIICPKHGEFTQTATDHLSGCGCPSCKTSKGEEIVAQWLNQNNIKYIFQHDVKINGSHHYYDFYLPEHNTIIEYNGKQHYFPIEFFGGQKSFRILQERDKIKANYCNENNINFLTISYKEKAMIDTILNNKLNG